MTSTPTTTTTTPPPPTTSFRLPSSLLSCYLLNSAAATLPITAFAVWLNVQLAMPFDMQSRYYATIFTPWALKPIMSLLAEKLPIYGMTRTPWVVLGGIGFSASLIASSTLDGNAPWALVFLLGICRSAFEAMSECVLGLVLLDSVEKEMNNDDDTMTLQDKRRMLAQRAQSQANAARIAGSILSYSVGFAFYGCAAWSNGDTTTTTTSHDDTGNWTPQSVIFITSVLPLGSAIIGCALPEPRLNNRHTCSYFSPLQLFSPWRASTPPIDSNYVVPSLSGDDGGDGDDDCQHENPPPSPTVPHSWIKTAFGVGLVQFTLAWTSMENVLENHTAWVVIMILDLVFCICVALYVMFWASSSDTDNTAETFNMRDLIKICTFLFVLNAVPTPDSPYYAFKYNSLTPAPQCKLQVIALLSEVAGLVACTVHGRVARYFNNSDKCFVIITIANAFLLLVLNLPPALAYSTFPTTGIFGISPLVYLVFAAFMDAFFSRLAFISQEIIATEKCYVHIDHNLSPGVIYGIIISLLDFGESASGWLSAPLISAMGVTFESFSGLWSLVVIQFVLTIVCVLLYPLCLVTRSQAATAVVHHEEHNHEMMAEQSNDTEITPIVVVRV